MLPNFGMWSIVIMHSPFAASDVVIIVEDELPIVQTEGDKALWTRSRNQISWQ